jgi:UDP:flavonoid glycosyltransferase YjiC (YdhE family)
VYRGTTHFGVQVPVASRRVRVLLASAGGSGHLGPLLPVLSELVRRGDEVLLVVPPGLAGTADGTGSPYVLGEDPPQAEVGPLWERFAVAAPAEQAVLANRELFGRLCTTAMLPTLKGAFERFRPDLVVREPAEYASAAVAEQRGVRHVQVAIGLAEVEAASVEVAAPALRAFDPDLPERLLAAPYVTRLPAALGPSPFPTTLRVRDPTPHERPRPLPDWWAGSTDPLVYLTLGTVAGSLPEATEVYRAAVAAVDGLPVRVLVTLGHDGDAALLGTLPSNVHAERWVPQRDVLAQAAVVLCHGGSGTTFGALEMGVPLVVVPLFADQPANGRLVAQAGAGLVCGRSADQLRQGLLRVLQHGAYRRRATELGQAMQAQPDLSDVLDDLARVGEAR